MSDTPETDAMIAADWHNIDDDEVSAAAYWRMVKLAQPLERERNALREAVRNLRDVKGRLADAECKERLFSLLPESQPTNQQH